MREFDGWARIKVEFEVEDDATDLEIEEAFNDALDERMASGLEDYNYYEV